MTDGAAPTVDWPALQAAKAAGLAARLDAHGLDALVVQDMHSHRWLTGYSPYMRILPPTAQVAVLMPPGRVLHIPIAYYVDDARRRAPWLEVADPGDAGAAAAVLDALGPARRVGGD